MNKPDWKDAPEWANWLAMDENGSWWWFEQDPEPENHMGLSGIWATYWGRALQVSKFPNWKKSLEKKPHD